MQAGKTRNSQPRLIERRPKWPMSAYSASAPVTASTIAASAKNAMWKCPARNPIAYVGESALRIAVCSVMPPIPAAPITVNQAIITGPKTRPTDSVPRRWTRNNMVMMTAVIGTTYSASDGSTVFRPSTADSTEIAGVMMPSPKNSDAPNRPTAARTAAARRPGCVERQRRSSVISAITPPSPSLSARIASRMYVTVTMIITDQKISDTTPYTLLSLTGTGCGSSGLNTVWRV